MKSRQHLATALVLLLLAGCAGQQTQVPTEPNWARHSARIEALSKWTAEGKLALRTPQQAESASLLWQQEGQDTRLHLSGPLGLKATTVVSDGRQLEIRQGDEISTWDISDTAAITSESGWTLPLQALSHWLKGVPAPGSDIKLLELDQQRTLLQTLRQGDWEIRYERYDTFGEFSLPIRLSIRREDTRARVIIRRWQVPPGG